MLQQILDIRMEIDRFDASDALAVALCHHYQFHSPVNRKKTERMERVCRKKSEESDLKSGVWSLKLSK